MVLISACSDFSRMNLNIIFDGEIVCQQMGCLQMCKVSGVEFLYRGLPYACYLLLSLAG